MTRTIEKERIIHATPERTFQALSEKEELERWFCVKYPRINHGGLCLSSIAILHTGRGVQL